MATGSGGRIYQEDDLVDDSLLNQLSKWILYHRLPSLARDLGMSHAQFSRIATPVSTAEEQTFKVLYQWKNKNTMTVRDLITEMVAWQQSRYLDAGVWEQFQSRINPAVLPSDMSALQLAPPTGQSAVLSYMDFQHGGSLPAGAVVTRTVTTMKEEFTFPGTDIPQISSGSEDAPEGHCIVTMPPSLDDSDMTQAKQYLNVNDDSALTSETVQLDTWGTPSHTAEDSEMPLLSEEDPCAGSETPGSTHSEDISNKRSPATADLPLDVQPTAVPGTSDSTTGQDSPMNERLSYIRTCLAHSTRNRFTNFMSTDWLPLEETRRFPHNVYTEQCWTRTIKGILLDSKVDMDSLYDIFTIYKDNSRVLAEGVAGSGKSSAAAKLALDWAGNEESADLDQSHGNTNTLVEKFDFMFMIQLKNIDSDLPLERFIIQQYELEDKGIAEDEIKKILNSPKCLLVFDGYDEYKKGTNSSIDAAISNQNGHSFVLITSRPNHLDNKDKKKLDGEIQIKGLSDESVNECIKRYFDYEEVPQPGADNEDPARTSEGFKKNAKKRGIYGLLKIPILLLMLSVLYVETGSLPERRSDIIWEIIQIYIKRAEEKGIPIENPDELLCHLGELSYDASQRDTHGLLIKKNDVEEKCSDILKLGLLQEDMSPQKAHTGIREQPEWLTFPHKIFYDFVMAFYIERKGEEGIKLLFDWTKCVKFFLPLSIVDDDVRFVMELTTNQWLYRHYIIGRLLFIFDRIVDTYIVTSILDISRSISWFVCLVLYLIFRLISLVLWYTKLCKCYAVRTVIPCILSGLICTAEPFAQGNLDPEFAYDDGHCVVRTVALSLCVYCLLYVCPIFWIVRRYTFVDDDIFLHEVKSNVLFSRSRSDVMYLDGISTIFAIYLFVFSYQVSVSWFVCFIIFIILRLISFKLSYNTKPFKFYAIWNVKAWAISTCLWYVTASVSFALNIGANTCSASIGNHTLPSNSTYVNSSLQYMEREYLDFTLTTISSSFYDNSSQNSLYS